MNEEVNQVEQVVEQPVEQPVVNENKERIARENFVAMRRRLEEEEALRKKAEQRALEAEERAAQRSAHENTPQPDIDEEFLGDPDDVAYNKTVQKTFKKTASKISKTEQELQELKQRLEIFEAKSEIDALKDFNDVVSKDNIQTFARLYPDEYQTIMAAPNLRSRSKMAYNMIKNYGISETSPLLKQAEDVRMAEKKIELNKQKPTTSAGISASPMKTLGKYDADGRLVLSDEDRDRINKEVMRKLGRG